MSGVRLALATALVAAGVLVALLAGDVRAWPSALAVGDSVFAATPARATWTPSTRLGGAAESMLGVGDDVALRRALQLYADAVGRRQRLDNALDVQTARAQAEDALAAAAVDRDPHRESQARVLLGVLAFGAAAQGGGTSQIDAAVSDFTDAIRVDPGNELAKFDLELLLRLTLAQGVRAGQGTGGVGHTGRRGAGGGVPGSGY